MKRFKNSVWILALCVLFAGCIDSRSDDSLGIWYGPASMDYAKGRIIRSDFIEQITDTENWPTVYGQTAVFKQFIESLGGNKYRDDDLATLATFLREAGIKNAFEIGALRWSKDLYGPGSGKTYAAREIKDLQRWVKAGGTVDYLTTDHAVMWNVGLCLQGSKPMAGLGDPDWRKAMDEVVDSLAMIQMAFPNAKIGMIESLGYFSVGEKYTTTDPNHIYPIDFKTFLRAAQEKLSERGVELDHVHLDFSYQDCRYDGRKEQRLDYGRILAAEEIVQSLGLDSGMIINAFDDLSYGGGNSVRSTEDVNNTAQRSASAVKNTLEYFDGYVAAGGDPDTWIFQRWQPFPDLTGPETIRDTDMGVSRLLVNKLKELKN
jgi:hypothetical protein